MWLASCHKPQYGRSELDRVPKKWLGNGRPPKLLGRDSKHRPISARKLAIGLPAHAWHKITWREGTAERLSSRFARVRVRPAHRDYWLAEAGRRSGCLSSGQ